MTRWLPVPSCLRYSSRYASAAVLATVLACAPRAAQGRAPLQAPGTTAVTELLGKGRALELRGRTALAEQTWQQVLLLDATNAEALEGLVRAARQEGKPAEAAQYLGQLRAAHPEDPNLATLGRDEAPAHPVADAQQAARLAAAGHLPEALTLYRRLYGTNPPPGEAALAYYKTEGALEASRPEAIAGLRAFVDRFPHDVRYQRVLGSLLVQNVRTRSEGRKLLNRAPGEVLLADATPVNTTAEAAPSSAVSAASTMSAASTVSAVPAVSAAASAGAVKPETAHPESNAPRAVPAAPAAVPAEATLTARSTPLPLSLPAAPLRPDKGSPVGAPSSRVPPATVEIAQSLPVAAPVRSPAIPEPKAAAPEPKAAAPESKAAAPEPKAAAPEPKAAAPEPKAAVPEPKAAAPEPKAAVPEPKAAAPEPSVAVQEHSPAAPASRRAAADRPKTPTLASSAAPPAQQPAPVAVPLPVAVSPDRPGTPGLPDAPKTGPAAPSVPAVEAASRPAEVPRSSDPPAVPQALVSAASARATEAEQRGAVAALHAHHYTEAEARFKVVLAREPDNRLALEGLDQVHRRADTSVASPRLAREARLLPASVPTARGLSLDRPPATAQVLPAVEPPTGAAPALPSATAASGARVASKTSAAPSSTTVSEAVSLGSQGRPVEARQVLEAALKQSASGSVAQSAKASVPVQLELGRMDLREGRVAEAYALARAALATDFNRADAWALLAAALHGSGHDADALAQIGAAPAVVRPQLEDDPLYLETLGWIHAGKGEDEAALASWGQLEQHLSTQGERLAPEVAVERARLVAGSGDEAQRSASLLALGSRADLSDDQRRTVQGLWAEWSVEEATTEARTGDSARALGTLHAAATAFSASPAVLRVIAAGYAAIHQPKEAVTLLRAQDLAKAPAPEDAVAIQAALEIREARLADTWLRTALLRYPRDARILQLAARFEETQGRRRESAAYQQAALAVTAAQAQPAGSGNAGTLATGQNPAATHGPGRGTSAGGGNLIALLQPPRALPVAKTSANVNAGRPFLPALDAAPTPREVPGAGR